MTATREASRPPQLPGFTYDITVQRATEIVGALPFPTVVLTAGSDGAYVPGHIPAAPAVVVDPTGAGDAFAAGFLAAYDGDATAAARAAVVVAARAVTTAGGRP